MYTVVQYSKFLLLNKDADRDSLLNSNFTI